jgi:hypothetical protein
MIMKIKNIESKSKILFGGLFKNIPPDYFEININFEKIRINSKIFIKNELKNLKDLSYLISSEEFNKIINEGKFKEMDIKSLGYYKSYQDMYLEYIALDNNLLVFTYGEKQPSLWIIILEGIWELKTSDTTW